jgi:flagellar biosynthesis protein FlhF
MQIKRFEAKDMKTALRLIKDELGPEAVILSARSLKKENKILGMVKAVGVEVTAAIDASHIPATLNSTSYARALNDYRLNAPVSQPEKRPSQRLIESRIKSLTQGPQDLDSGKRVRFGNDDLLADVFQHLLSQGVNRDVVNDIIEKLTHNDDVNRFDSKAEIISKITAILRQKRNGAGGQRRSKTRPQVVAFIGPTGVGKTTTVAKLAAQHAIEQNKKVAFISLDSYRIGAAEELKVYAKAIGIPVKTASTPSAFRAVVKAFRKYDLVLVDTPGFSPENPNEIDNLKAYLQGTDSIEIHLLLSAGTKESDLFNTLKRLNTLAVQYLIFTKLDESCTYGNLINLLIRYSLPLSFFTSGRQVPHSIERGSLEKIVEHLLGSFKNHKAISISGGQNQSRLKPSGRLAESYFIANKNSDVFHCPDCKWTKKIKAKNLITFSSAQAAKIQHFMPCRDCQPAQNDTFQVGLSALDNMRISNFS